MLHLFYKQCCHIAGADLVLCKDSDTTYQTEGNVLSPTYILASQGPGPCNLRIDGIPSGSWVGVFNMGQFRNMYASPSKVIQETDRAWISLIKELSSLDIQLHSLLQSFNSLLVLCGLLPIDHRK